MKKLSSENTPAQGERWTRRGAAALALLIGSPALGACGVVGEHFNDTTLPTDMTVEITTYKGRDLKCLAMTLPKRSSRAYDCDFSDFYAHPDYRAPASAARVPEGDLAVHNIEYGQNDVTCLVYDIASGINGATCDFVALAQTEPRPTPTPTPTPTR